MSLLIAFAAGVAAASVSPQAVAATLARERGIQVDAGAIQLQVARESCGEMHVLRLRRFEQRTEVTLRCSQSGLPFVALVTNFTKQDSFQLPTKQSGAAPLVRRGATVRLLVRGAGLRMTLPAICLEAGRAGETVRVRVPGTHLVRVARIESATEVLEDVQ